MDALDLAIQKRLAIYGTNQGHGHVWRRPDGRHYRCGGTKMCPQCMIHAGQLQAARDAVAEACA